MESTPCKHLRTKALFIPSMAARAFDTTDTQEAAIRQCWCNKTMTEIGLDERHVAAEYCSDPKRACYRAL